MIPIIRPPTPPQPITPSNPSIFSPAFSVPPLTPFLNGSACQTLGLPPNIPESIEHCSVPGEKKRKGGKRMKREWRGEGKKKKGQLVAPPARYHHHYRHPLTVPKSSSLVLNSVMIFSPIKPLSDDLLDRRISFPVAVVLVRPIPSDLPDLYDMMCAYILAAIAAH